MIIITTVGTSLMTNLIKDEFSSFNFDIGTSLRKEISTGKLNRESSDVESAISNHLKGNDKYPKDGIYGINLNASSEIKSICKIANGNPATIYLLATDTFMSEYAAKQIHYYLNANKGLHVLAPIRVNGLDIDQPDRFETVGFDELVTNFEYIRSIHKEENLILNISGGYKAMIPLTTIYAQLSKSEIAYIYENSEKIVRLGQMPLDFDWTIAELHYEYLTSKDLREETPTEDFIVSSMMRRGYLKSDKSLTALGDLLRKYIEKHLPQRSDVLGHYMEHKLFESFFYTPYKNYSVKSIGEAYYVERGNFSIFCKESMEGYERIEFDVELESPSGKTMWIECKSFAQKGQAINQVLKFLEFNKQGLQKQVEEIGIFIYKYQFQNISKNPFLPLYKKAKEEYGVDITIFYWNIPFNSEKESITYKKIFESRLVLGDNLNILNF